MRIGREGGCEFFSEADGPLYHLVIDQVMLTECFAGIHSIPEKVDKEAGVEALQHPISLLCTD
jgi:hypothetical protein